MATSSHPLTTHFLWVLKLEQDSSEQLCGRRSDFQISKVLYIDNWLWVVKGGGWKVAGSFKSITSPNDTAANETIELLNFLFCAFSGAVNAHKGSLLSYARDSTAIPSTSRHLDLTSKLLKFNRI